jgi:hypothetical protein
MKTGLQSLFRKNWTISDTFSLSEQNKDFQRKNDERKAAVQPC